MIECNKDSCKAKYIGETRRTFSEKIYDHINYIKQNKIKNQLVTATRIHVKPDILAKLKENFQRGYMIILIT